MELSERHLYLLLFPVIVICQCAARPPIVQIGRILPYEKFSISSTFTKHENRSTLILQNDDRISGDSGRPGIFDMEGRYGIGRKLDIGGRLGMGGIGGDIKYCFFHERKYWPSMALDSGGGLLYLYTSIVISKDLLVGKWIFDPLINVNFKYNRNDFWLQLPEQYRTYSGGEVSNVVGEVVEDGIFLEIPLGLEILTPPIGRSRFGIIFALAPQYYFMKQVRILGCINCEEKMRSFDHDSDILYLLQIKYEMFE